MNDNKRITEAIKYLYSYYHEQYINSSMVLADLKEIYFNIYKKVRSIETVSRSFRKYRMLQIYKQFGYDILVKKEKNNCNYYKIIKVKNGR